MYVYINIMILQLQYYTARQLCYKICKQSINVKITTANRNQHSCCSFLVMVLMVGLHT